jgi:hypothetical protein
VQSARLKSKELLVMRGRLRVALLLAVMMLTFGGATAANADCVSAEVSWRVLGGNSAYIVGPKRCVVNTPYKEGITYTSGPVEVLGTGVSVGVWVPLP